jgi:hypothetical protein
LGRLRTAAMVGVCEVRVSALEKIRERRKNSMRVFIQMLL